MKAVKIEMTIEFPIGEHAEETADRAAALLRSAGYHMQAHWLAEGDEETLTNEEEQSVKYKVKFLD